MIDSEKENITISKNSNYYFKLRMGNHIAKPARENTKPSMQIAWNDHRAYYPG
jgi:hypothetical protein